MRRETTPQASAGGRRDAGFGLIELIVVITLIGILTAIAVPSFTAVQTSMKNGATQADLRSNRTALVEYGIDNNGVFPPTGADPRAAGTDLIGYGWSQGNETTAFRYYADAGRTAWCLDMTSTTGSVWRISTNTDQAQAPCSALAVSAY